MSFVSPVSRRMAFLFVAVSSTFFANAQQAASPQGAMVKQFCAGCHNGKTRVAGLVLDEIAGQSVAAHPEQWEKVIRKLRGHYMPPPGVPHPDDRTYDTVLASPIKDLNANAAAKPDPGRTNAVRRLTRTEYKNALRDLLDLEVDVAPLLPADESSHGFDNITVVNLSPTLLEKYLSAA